MYDLTRGHLWGWRWYVLTAALPWDVGTCWFWGLWLDVLAQACSSSLLPGVGGLCRVLGGTCGPGALGPCTGLAPGRSAAPHLWDSRPVAMGAPSRASFLLLLGWARRCCWDVWPWGFGTLGGCLKTLSCYTIYNVITEIRWIEMNK